jgi:hypothetical protein
MTKRKRNEFTVHFFLHYNIFALSHLIQHLLSDYNIIARSTLTMRLFQPSFYLCLPREF